MISLPDRPLSAHDVKSPFGNKVVSDILNRLVTGKCSPIIEADKGIECTNHVFLQPTLYLAPSTQITGEKSVDNNDIVVENFLRFRWSFETPARKTTQLFYQTPGSSGVEASFIKWPLDFYILPLNPDSTRVFALKHDDLWIIIAQENNPDMAQYIAQIQQRHYVLANPEDELHLPVFKVSSSFEAPIEDARNIQLKGVRDFKKGFYYTTDAVLYKQSASLELSEYGWFGEAKTRVEMRTLSMPPQNPPRRFIVNSPFGCAILTGGKPAYFVGNISVV